MEALIKDAHATRTKKGRQMIIGTMVQNSEDVAFLAFEPECLEMIGVVRSGNTITVKKSGEYQGKTVLKEVALVKEGRTGLSKDEQEQMFNDLLAIIPPSFSALKELWLEHKEAIKKSPAATGHHHNYEGGLLQHLSELKKAVDSLTPEFTAAVDLDVVYAGIALHDFAKIWEYTIEDGVIGVNDAWLKYNLSHIHWAFAWAINHNELELSHLVASHHGLVDWGALTEPESPEAYLLFIADMLSARLGKLHAYNL